MDNDTDTDVSAVTCYTFFQ